MVWWHGGAYKEGSSFGPFNLYDGGVLVKAHSVVMVSCNYRLDVLGSLVHPGGLDGNYGLKDQRACLQWVRDEIHNFGGNASQVTVWGQSAGAQSIYFHMASQGSKGLFHRAILESPCDLSLQTKKDAGRLGHEVARKLGCNNHTDAEIVQCLKTADVDALQHAAGEAENSIFTDMSTLSLSHLTASMLPFKPNVDGVDLVEQPMQTLLRGTAPAAVPAIIGFTHDEMWALISSFPAWVKHLEIDAALAILFGVGTAHRAWEYYSAIYGKDNDEAIAVKVLTDFVFTCSAQAVAAKLPQPVHVYQYNHLDSFGPQIFQQFGLPQCEHRACHMAEIPLVFGNEYPQMNVSFSQAERALARNFSSAFAAFASGQPALGGSWPTFNASARAGMLINSSDVFGPLGAAAQACLDVWDKTGYVH